MLEILESLMERHGLDVGGGNKALAEIVKLAEARDAAMRAAASSCLVFAYKVGGEDAWKYIGRVGGQMRDALEDKFAKAEKEMDRKNEGRPGAWLKDGRLVGRGTGIAHAAGGAVPVPAALVGASTSRSIAAPVASPRLPRPWDRPSPPPQPPCSDPSARRCPPSSRDEETPRKRPTRPAPEAARRAEEDRIVGWTRALGAVASVSDAEAVEGMKAMCHEIMGVAGDAALGRWRRMRLPRRHLADASAIFDPVAPGPSTTARASTSSTR